MYGKFPNIGNFNNTPLNNLLVKEEIRKGTWTEWKWKHNIKSSWNSTKGNDQWSLWQIQRKQKIEQT